MDVLKGANLALRFGLELAALASLGYWGFTVDANVLVRWLLGLGTPLAAAVLWGMFVSPRANVDAPLPVVLLIELGIFAAAVGALAATGRTSLALALAAVVVLNEVGLVIFDQRATGGSVGGDGGLVG